MASSMTWMNNNSSTARRKAGRLSRPFRGETGHRGGRQHLVWVRNESSLWRRGIGTCILAAQSQITVGQHHQSHVAVQARPEPAFVVVQSQLSLGILVESFDYPPAVGQGHLVMQCEGIKTPGEEKFVLPIVPFHGALADEATHVWRGACHADLLDRLAPERNA